ncbi:nuclear transport factor 2 family protein [Sphingomonas alpina]|uniref:Nuclear transport factor 2 family protein n=1 Tax=Sphingomonas alpina TaxID=653931 RepID=A0A7H0LL35_9SPHN|nr:nuclear transport factor 2 family protein [Sphingomonas alpina]QNQ10388.1 nuclear transport factor 2 family protein [Sphingomonas alpina]
MSTDANKAIVKRIFNAMAEGDRSAFGDALHPDFAWQATGSSSWSRRWEGLDTVRRDLFRPLFAQFDGQYRSHATRMIAEGDLVMVEVQGDVRTRRGGRYNNQYCYICRFAGGQMIELIEYMDTALIDRELGTYEEALATVKA